MSEKGKITCDNIHKQSQNAQLMNHQKIVIDYISLYSPNRGALIYHGLGSGKTRESVGIAEGLKSKYKIHVMTPASLHANYVDEVKKWGDIVYRRNQHWEWIPIEDEETAKNISGALNISHNTIKRRKGAWLMDSTKRSNYSYLKETEKKSLNEQISEMIENKYNFIHYNGLTTKAFKEMTKNYTINIFDNSVVIIDEAHNFVSRIVNKINKMKKDVAHDYSKDKVPLSIMLYRQILSAQNCRVVFLSGTPIINYLNEIGILYNMLRGYIYTWELTLKYDDSKVLTTSSIKQILQKEKEKNTDYVSFTQSTKTLIVTRNPYNFENIYSVDSYDGVKYTNDFVSNDEFEKQMIDVLNKNKIQVTKSKIILNTALPDHIESFTSEYVTDDGNIKNIEKFKRRIIGLTSYFRSAQEELLPRYEKLLNFRVVKVPMSDTQFAAHEHERIDERNKDRNKRKVKKKQINELGLEVDSSSTYRIFSRLSCNFIIPSPPGRPKITRKRDEDDDGEGEGEDEYDGEDQQIVEDEHLKGMDRKSEYKKQITEVIEYLKQNPKYLTEELDTYSPKFKKIMENVIDPENIGLHMLYSQFRTLEGIGLFSLVLDANGFSKFGIRRHGKTWELTNRIDDGKPKYALYTGTEDVEEREIYRNIFNGSWENVPKGISEELKKVNSNNNLGEIIKLLMITASGSEGINLKNTRFVHIMESYWNPVRIEQVIGRARRICSHNDLPEELRTVDVFLYLAEFTKEQLDSNKSVELKVHDKSRFDKNKYVTSDEALYEIATIKERLTNSILRGIKESSFDCAIHTKSSSKEGLSCLSFGKTDSSSFAYNPNYKKDESDEVHALNRELVKWTGTKFEYGGKTYVYRKETNQLYDYESFMQSIQPGSNVKPILIGTLKEQDNGSLVLVQN